jgi:hypothetical protein
MDITEIDNELDILGYALSKATDWDHKEGLRARCNELLDMRNRLTKKKVAVRPASRLFRGHASPRT